MCLHIREKGLAEDDTSLCTITPSLFSSATMKTTFLALAAFASLAATYATPTLVTERATADVNPFLGKDVYLNPVFTAEVNAEIASLKAAGNTALAAKAAKIGGIPTFNWISTSKDVNNISGWLRDAKALQDKTGRKQRKLLHSHFCSIRASLTFSVFSCPVCRVQPSRPGLRR
jgi:hypothetical protein